MNGLAGAQDAAAALAAFRDERWSDPARTMLGPAQEQQLADAFRRSAAQGTRWQVLGQQVLVGTSSLSPMIAEWASAGASEQSRRRTALNLAAAGTGLPFNLDAWDGYPAARERAAAIGARRQRQFDRPVGRHPQRLGVRPRLGGSAAGVEFGGQSVTSPGIEGSLPKVDPRVVADVGRPQPQLKWANTCHRGYMTLQLTPERATSEWLFLDTVRRRSTAGCRSHG